MFDIHIHILPGVDDGAVNFEMACEMLDTAYEQGVRGIIATSHSDSFLICSSEIEKQFLNLSRYAAQKYPDLRLALGAEVYFSVYGADRTLQCLKSGRIPSMCGSRFILSEFSPFISAHSMLMILKKIIAEGWRPIIAHAERCTHALTENALFVEELLNMGCLIQVNAYSLAGEQNLSIHTLACRLIQHGQVHFIGSDAHRMNHRPPNVAGGIHYVQTHCPADYAEAILHKNAERMLMGDCEANWLTDGMLGLAVGDALGVPHEFISREALAENPVSDMTGYGAHNQSEGTWSDDTSMALCCADSLCKGFDERDMMKKFSDWLYHAHYTAGGVVFDSGISTRRAIAKFNSGYDALLCGGTSEDSNGNGSLMRTFPVSMWRLMTERGHILSDAELLTPVHAVSTLTHAHERSLIACGIYTLFIDEWMRRAPHDSLLSIASHAYERAIHAYREIGGAFAEEINAIDRFFHPRLIAEWDETKVSSSGYVLDTLHASLWCLLTTDDFASSVLKAVNLGEDTDTTAAVVGSLAGMIYGAASIPKKWLDMLKNRSLIERISHKLYESICGRTQPDDIRSFTKEYAHLALKYTCSVTIDDITYDNAQAAWLAQGTDKAEREAFSSLNAHQARRLFNQLPHTDEWEMQKFDILYEVCRAKYEQNSALREKLLSTNEMSIIYDTTGAHDNELGWCQCDACMDAEHKNRLGNILMKIRSQMGE